MCAAEPHTSKIRTLPNFRIGSKCSLPQMLEDRGQFGP